MQNVIHFVYEAEIMKVRKAAITASIILIISMGQVSAKPGNGGGKPGGGEEPPVVTSCSDKTSAFPAFAYTRLKTAKRNSISGFDIYLSNADGDCSVMVYSSSFGDKNIDLTYRQIGNDGIIAWRQNGDENAGRRDNAQLHDLIKVVRFQASNKEVTSALPLAANTVANSGHQFIGLNSIDLSQDGNTILFYHADGVTRAAEDVAVQTIREMDISSCLSNCNQNVLLFSSDIENFHNVSYSPSGNRIYFSGGIHSGDVRVSQGYIAFIEIQNGVWSTRRELTYEGNGYYGSNFTGFSTFRDLDVALVDLGSGVPTEAVTYTFNNIATGQFYVHLIDMKNCSISGSGDCLSSGKSSFELSIEDAKFPDFNNNALLFSADSSNNIYQYIFDSSNLSIVASGGEADSAN